MSSNYYCLKIVKSLGEINSFNEQINRQFNVLCYSDKFYEIYIYPPNSHRIFLCILKVKNDSKGEGQLNINECGEIYEIIFMKSIYLHFNIYDLVRIETNLWAIGSNCQIDILPYIKHEIKKYSSNMETDNAMDTDIQTSFHKSEFEIAYNVSKLVNLNMKKGNFYLAINFLDNLIIWQEDLKNKLWHLKTIMPQNVMKPIRNFINIDISLTIPKCLQEKQISSKEKNSHFSRPVFIFINGEHFHNTSLINKAFIFGLFGIKFSSPTDCIFLIGLSNGNIMWQFLEQASNENTSLELHLLYNIKQPVIGIYTSEKATNIVDKGEFLLIIGAMGKIVILSHEAIFKNSCLVKTSSSAFWEVTLNLSSVIINHVMLNNSIFYTSPSGQLWIASFYSEKQTSNKLLNKSDLEIHSSSTDFSEISYISVLDRKKELILLITFNGNLYLGKYMKKENITFHGWLPSLLNESLKQSIYMQELQFTKNLQSNIFAAISTFAAIKFKEKKIKELPLHLKEIEFSPRKFILEIELEHLEDLKLDPKLWFLIASVSDYFKENVITKTFPLNSDNLSFCIELQEISFPMIVEIGLILDLPKNMRYIECLKLVATKLPIYIKIQTTALHELYLIKNKKRLFGNIQADTISGIQNTCSVKSKLQQIVKNKPVINLLRLENNFGKFQFPQQFNFCLPISSVETIMKNFSKPDADLCQEFLKYLLRKSNIEEKYDKTNLLYRNETITFALDKSQNSLLLKFSATNFKTIVGLRMSFTEMFCKELLNTQSENSTYVNISSGIKRKCEELTKELMQIYGQNTISDELLYQIYKIYCQLRSEISDKLPFS